MQIFLNTLRKHFRANVKFVLDTIKKFILKRVQWIVSFDKWKRGLHKNEESQKSVGHRQGYSYLHNGRFQREKKGG